mgnify:CR=1 FL=1
MNHINKIKVRGNNFEGYYYDELDNKIEVDGEFDVVDGEVMLVSVETNKESVDLKSTVDVGEIEDAISNLINLDDYTSEYDHEGDL